MIPEHPHSTACEYLAAGHCYWCCSTCNYDRHICHFCGDSLDHNGLLNGKPNPCYEEET